MFSSIMSGRLFACSPGVASLVTTRPTGFFNFRSVVTSRAQVQSGACYVYNPRTLTWQAYGSPMNTFRGGATITRMGRFIVAMGKREIP